MWWGCDCVGEWLASCSSCSEWFVPAYLQGPTCEEVDNTCPEGFGPAPDCQRCVCAPEGVEDGVCDDRGQCLCRVSEQLTCVEQLQCCTIAAGTEDYGSLYRMTCYCSANQVTWDVSHVTATPPAPPPHTVMPTLASVSVRPMWPGGGVTIVPRATLVWMQMAAKVRLR